MTKSDPPEHRMTRRALIVGPVAATVALGGDPASAQRCPTQPPPRQKGPIVFRDMDQHELDENYDNDVYAFNSKHFGERRTFQNELAQSALEKPLRLAYGPTEIERLDLYKSKRTNAPVIVFIHGGAWRNGRASQFACYAEPYVKAGANVAVLDFISVRETKGDIFPLADQCRRAIAWLYRNAKSVGGNAEEIYLLSRSTGSHLAACVLINDWEKEELPSNIVKGAAMGSGTYDLKPVRLSMRSSWVTITYETEQALSPIRHIEKIQTPVAVAHGTLETPEYQRQTREFAEALNAAGKPVKYIVAKGYNHYDLGETVGHPYAAVGRALMEMIKLD